MELKHNEECFLNFNSVVYYLQYITVSPNKYLTSLITGFSPLFSTLVCGEFSAESFKLKFYNTERRLNILHQYIDFLLTEVCAKNLLLLSCRSARERERKA